MSKNPSSLETCEPATASITLQWATRKHSRTLTLGQPGTGDLPPGGIPSAGDGLAGAGLAGGRSGDDGEGTRSRV
ncbi:MULTISPECIES: hypothetical protein [Arthrobacter]|uniref:Uncharacterized protein n=1 Tax=Arthrobacter terricola TaxID=2547396 RepID=A0A4R5KEK6_9MICC|nr:MULTISPECIES: hypothetical protein [Arthrobacter]MBT8159725.1 hypothetical protein [Arthrobacter sp. GN70]TDF93673.1 hypothetical protein E1809_15700 [Arthrobacter terricola]